MVSRGQTLKILVSAVLKNLDFFFFLNENSGGGMEVFGFFFNLFISDCVGSLLLHMGFL